MLMRVCAEAPSGAYLALFGLWCCSDSCTRPLGSAIRKIYHTDIEKSSCNSGSLPAGRICSSCWFSLMHALDRLSGTPLASARRSTLLRFDPFLLKMKTALLHLLIYWPPCWNIPRARNVLSHATRLSISLRADHCIRLVEELLSNCRLVRCFQSQLPPYEALEVV